MQFNRYKDQKSQFNSGSYKGILMFEYIEITLHMIHLFIDYV